MAEPKDNVVLMVILSLLLPPVAIYLKKGTGAPLWINIVLCFVFYLPAVIHALYVTFQKPAA